MDLVSDLLILVLIKYPVEVFSENFNLEHRDLCADI